MAVQISSWSCDDDKLVGGLKNPHAVDIIAAGFSVAIPHQSILYGTLQLKEEVSHVICGTLACHLKIFCLHNMVGIDILQTFLIPLMSYTGSPPTTGISNVLSSTCLDLKLHTFQ